MSISRKKLIIVGGGAAGFFVAANLEKDKYVITLLERSKNPMQKIKISGGGRCNVTHACFDPKALVEFYPRGHKELRSVFTKFQPRDTMAWFEERGMELKTEADNRMFPISDSSQDVMDILLNAAIENGTKIHYRAGVTQILREENQWKVATKFQTFVADKIVFCTGSSPKAYEMLKALNLAIVDLVPSLFTFNIKDKTLDQLMGTSFENAIVKIPELKAEESGPLLITHWGLSGPVVLKLSAWCARELFKLNYEFAIEVNFLGISMERADEILLNYKKEHPKKAMVNVKIFEVTQRFWQNILEIQQIDPKKQIANLSKKEKQAILKNLCACRLSVKGKSTFKEEFVTAGGVDRKQIDFKTMRAKALDDFYLAGEVLDIDAITGGFNFQACWSEAWLITQDLNNL
ncbi:MAG TPA: NAD(P)/FAD-dependent oxidoreductase [Flavobacteriaceae bacterium]|nr:NAD(P)/FAD-dependent oxidoreductase [Flavobacteriaceae bacterium]